MGMRVAVVVLVLRDKAALPAAAHLLKDVRPAPAKRAPRLAEVVIAKGRDEDVRGAVGLVVVVVHGGNELVELRIGELVRVHTLVEGGVAGMGRYLDDAGFHAVKAVDDAAAHCLQGCLGVGDIGHAGFAPFSADFVEVLVGEPVVAAAGGDDARGIGGGAVAHADEKDDREAGLAAGVRFYALGGEFTQGRAVEKELLHVLWPVIC